MDEFVPISKHMKSRESKIPIPSKEMTANCLLSVLDINYVTYDGKCVQYCFFSAADLLSAITASKVSDM